MKETLGKITSAIIIMVYCGMMVFSSEIPSAMQKSRMRLEHYLDRASLERSDENWIETAERGLNEALALWESENLTLKENESGWKEERENAENLFKQNIRVAYEKWLSDKLSEEIQGRTDAELKKLISQAAKERIANGLDPESALAEEEAWKRKSDEIIENYLASLRAENGETFGQELTDTLRCDGRLIAEKEGRLMLLEVLYDKKSAKSLTEGENAKVIAQEIAEDVSSRTSFELDRLFESIPPGIESEKTEQILKGGLSNNFAERFKSELLHALDSWDAAETEFLSKRSEWEKSATKTYLESESQWQDAFNLLCEKRTAWEKSIEEKLRIAQEKFKSETEEYSRQINEALTEYSAVLEESSARKQYLAQTESEVYEKARSVAVSAKEGIESWGVLWSERYRNLYNYWGSSVPAELNSILAENKNSGAKNFNVKNVDDEKIERISSILEDFKKKSVQRAINIYNGKVSAVINARNSQVGLINRYIAHYAREIEYDSEGGWHYVSTNYRMSADSPSFEVSSYISQAKSGIYSDCWHRASSSDEEDYFNESAYQSNCDELDAAWDNFLAYKQQLADLNKYSNFANVINTYFSNNEYAEIERYTKEVYENTVLGQNVVLPEYDLKSCAELIRWLTTAKNSFEQAEQAQQILYELSMSGGEFLSELEREIIKAKAEVETAREEKLIADALNEYASTTDWTREQSSETVRKVEKAKASYDEAFKEYERTAGEIAEFEADIEKAQQKLDKSVTALEQAQSEMEIAKTAYDAAMASFKGVSCQTVSLQLVYLINNYKELLAKRSEKETDYYKSLNKGSFEKEEKEFADTLKNYSDELLEKIAAFSKLSEENLKNGNARDKAAEITDDEKLLMLAQNIDEIFESEFEEAELNEEELSQLLTGDEELDEEIRQNAIAELEALNEENRILFEKEKEEKLLEAEKLLKERISVLSMLERIKGYSAGGQNLEEIESTIESDIEKLTAGEIKDAIEAGGEYSRKRFDERNDENLKKLLAIIEKYSDDKICATGYAFDGVTAHAKELKEAAIKSGMYNNARADNYIRLYLEKEAYRYSSLADSINTEELKAEYNSLLSEYEVLLNNEKLSEEEIKKSSELEIKLIFLGKVISFAEEKNMDWAKRLVEAGLCSEVNISDSDRKNMSDILPVLDDLILTDYENRLAVVLAQLKDTGSVSYTADAGNAAEYNDTLEELAETKAQIKNACSEYEQFKSADTIGNAAEKLEEYTYRQKITEEAEKSYLQFAQELQDACEAYNAKSEEIADAYKALDEKRLEKRIAQEVADWAGSVYLENMGVTEEEAYLTPKERASKADFAYKKAQLSLAVLEEILGKEDSRELSLELDERLEAYKEADKKYYSALVLRYEAEKTLNAKKAEVEAAEIQAMNLRLSAIRGTCYENESNLVYITKNDDGSYRFALRNADTSAIDNSAVQQEYLDKKVIEVKHEELVTGEWYTQAEEDLYRWYKSMMGSGIFEDVALAAMYVLAGKGLLYPNPYVDSSTSGYTTGIGDPHGIDADEKYLWYRKGEMQNAYSRMISSGYESEIAKYIFFAETSSSVFQAQNQNFFVQIMKERGLQDLENRMGEISMKIHS